MGPFISQYLTSIYILITFNFELFFGVQPFPKNPFLKSVLLTTSTTRSIKRIEFEVVTKTEYLIGTYLYLKA